MREIIWDAEILDLSIFDGSADHAMGGDFCKIDFICEKIDLKYINITKISFCLFESCSHQSFFYFFEYFAVLVCLKVYTKFKKLSMSVNWGIIDWTSIFSKNSKACGAQTSTISENVRIVLMVYNVAFHHNEVYFYWTLLYNGDFSDWPFSKNILFRHISSCVF